MKQAEGQPRAPLPHDDVDVPGVLRQPLKDGITWRACLLGLVLTLLFALATPYNDNVWHNNYFIGNDLPLTLVFILLVLNAAVNPLLGRRRLRAAEMAVGVGMGLISCAFPSSGFYRIFSPLLADSVYFVSYIPWYAHYLHALPGWMLPSSRPDSAVLRNYFLGLPPHSSHGAWWMWRPWLPVFVAWAFFFVPMFAAVVLFCVLMRRQWVQRERLAFPLAVIPLEMMADPAPGRRLNTLWRSRLLWLGAAIPFSIHLLNGAALFYPWLPKIPLRYHFRGAFTEHPWNLLDPGIQSARIYFTFIGAAYFTPLDVSFSIWLLYLLYSVVKIFVPPSPARGYDELYQGMGTVWAYGIVLLVLARRHLREVWQSMGKPRQPDEFLSSRANVLGLLACVLLAAGFLAFAYGNIFSPANMLLGLLVVVIVLFYGMVVTRLVIEGGILLCQLPAGLMPFDSMCMLLGNSSTALTVRQAMSSLFASNLSVTDYRETLMPLAADALRLGEESTGRRRPRYLLLLAGSMVLCLAVSGFVNIVLSYRHGRQSFDNGFGPISFPEGTMAMMRHYAAPRVAVSTAGAWLWLAVGAAAMLALFCCRWYFAGFPLHPLGLLLLNTWSAEMLWYSLLVAWGLKAAILRWGGAPVYEKAKPFFIGLIVGDAMAAVFWIIFGAVHGWPGVTHAYLVLPT